MNKQIKFRAWNHHYKKMFDVVNIDIDSKPMTGYVNFQGKEQEVKAITRPALAQRKRDVNRMIVL